MIIPWITNNAEWYYIDIYWVIVIPPWLVVGKIIRGGDMTLSNLGVGERISILLCGTRTWALPFLSEK